ncbi:MAG: hypothetical protein MI976_18950 [Pseudomonadales bacterium]|nr:hypothetical protein [Pseudomonadales bacterium]
MDKQKENRGPNVLSPENTSPDQLSAFERWELPNIEDKFYQGPSSPFKTQATPAKQKPVPQPPEDTVAEDEEIKPLTAEQLEEIRQAAYEEGKEEGKAEGYKEGYEQGYKSGESDLKAALTKLAQISRALLEPIPNQDDELEAVLLQLVENICTRVVRRELILDSKSVLTVVKEAIGCINPGAERIRIHLNPSDADFVTSELKATGELESNWRFLAHPTISPGGCIVDTDTSVVDMRAEKRLATIIKQVYERDPKALEADHQQESAGLDQLLSEVSSFQEDEDTDADKLESDAENGYSDREESEKPNRDKD